MENILEDILINAWILQAKTLSEEEYELMENLWGGTGSRESKQAGLLGVRQEREWEVNQSAGPKYRNKFIINKMLRKNLWEVKVRDFKYYPVPPLLPPVPPVTKQQV